MDRGKMNHEKVKERTENMEEKKEEEKKKKKEWSCYSDTYAIELNGIALQ